MTLGFDQLAIEIHVHATFICLDDAILQASLMPTRGEGGRMAEEGGVARWVGSCGPA